MGQLFAAAFFLIGLLGGNFLLALIGVFIFFGATGEAQMVRQRELTRGLRVSEVMGTKPRTETVTPYHTFGQVLDSVIHGYQEDFPVVEENGNLVGMITREEIMAAAHSPERYTSVRELMKRNVPTISSQADLYRGGSTHPAAEWAQGAAGHGERRARWDAHHRGCRPGQPARAADREGLTLLL